jgi:hypothetical protein
MDRLRCVRSRAQSGFDRLRGQVKNALASLAASASSVFGGERDHYIHRRKTI